MLLRAIPFSIGAFCVVSNVLEATATISICLVERFLRSLSNVSFPFLVIEDPLKSTVISQGRSSVQVSPVVEITKAFSKKSRNVHSESY